MKFDRLYKLNCKKMIYIMHANYRLHGKFYVRTFERVCFTIVLIEKKQVKSRKNCNDIML